MPSMMWGIGSDPRGVDPQLGGVGVNLKGRADHDRAEVKGADRGGVDGDQGEWRAVVGAGQVEATRGVGEGRADAIAGERACPTWEACGQEGCSVSATPPFWRAASMSASGQKGYAGELAGDPPGQDERVGGDLLFCVVAGEMDEVGGVGTGV